MIYRLVWQATMAAHFLVIAYIALGGFLAWRRPRLIWPHLTLCAWGLVQLAGLVECPLTALENWGRAGAGNAACCPAASSTPTSRASSTRRRTSGTCGAR
ncbi:hypothetical protein GCM10027612_39710 [Microbispora bryophytorum subsp. camponoti]